MIFTRETPTIARLEFDSGLADTLKTALTYTDQSIKYEYEKLKKSQWAAKSDPYYLQRLDYLKNNIKQCLLKNDDNGWYTYTGLYNHLKEYMKLYQEEVVFKNKVVYPDQKLLPYALNYTPQTPRYYQNEAVEALLDGLHCSISLPTGSGKSLVIEKLIKRLGLRTLVVAPTTSIASQLYDQMLSAFGKKYIGMVGDGKKQFGKQITIAIGASLTRMIDPEQIEDIQKNQVLIVDESHTFAADTLFKVAVDLCKDISYRFFISATQMRGDGRDLLLDSIIGPIVYSKDFKELVNEGFLADLRVKMIQCPTTSSYNNPNNPKKMAQEHFLYNPIVLKNAAKIINDCLALGEPMVILCDEIEQINALTPMLRYSYEIASSKTKVSDIVERFNNGTNKLLLGTSAISMGTDIKPIKHLINLRYGSSEVMIKQALGRATRLVPGKKSCEIYDFNVTSGSGPGHFKKKFNIFKYMGLSIEVIK